MTSSSGLQEAALYYSESKHKFNRFKDGINSRSGHNDGFIHSMQATDRLIFPIQACSFTRIVYPSLDHVIQCEATGSQSFRFPKLFYISKVKTLAMWLLCLRMSGTPLRKAS